jgi:plastocyanin
MRRSESSSEADLVLGEAGTGVFAGTGRSKIMGPILIGPMRTAIVAAALCAAMPAVAAPAARNAISGRVVFEGTPPPRQPLARESDPVCAGTQRLAEDVVVTDGGLRDVMVRVTKGAPKSAKPPAAPAVVTQRECMYEPRVVGVVAGGKVVVRNGDPTFHNVRAAQGPRTLWNLSQPAQAPEIVKDITGAPGDVVGLHCDVHPWMKAFAVVSDSPYFAVTGADGAFSIAGLPPGTYTLEAWHSTLGTKTATVTIGKAKKPAPVVFRFAR